MRNATILVVRLRGVAGEVIKNIVLAGIGALVMVDDENVTEENLGAGLFFRDDDVGKKVSKILRIDSPKDLIIVQRVDVAKARAQSLNPQVTVKAIDKLPLQEPSELDDLVKPVDLVCVMDCSQKVVVSSSPFNCALYSFTFPCYPIPPETRE
jgi:ubiquitin-like 1-activating enzyme E1 A